MPSASPKAHTRVLRFRRSLKLLRRPAHYYSPRLFIIRLEGIKGAEKPPSSDPSSAPSSDPSSDPSSAPSSDPSSVPSSYPFPDPSSVSFMFRFRFRFPAPLAVPFSGSVRDRFSRDREGCSIHRRLSACRCRYKSSQSEHLSDRF